jgi:hypothetical protein
MISHVHRCIFVHIPKTGGTSIENIVWPRPEQRTSGDLWMGFIDKYHNKYQTGGLQHLLARHIRTEIGTARFEGYFKFTVVRNPWDKAVSQYAYMSERQDLREFIGMREGDSFKRYLELIGTRGHVQWEPQLAFVNDLDGNSIVDYVGRFERFSESVRHVLDRIGVDCPQIPHEARSKREPYQTYYDRESMEMVGSLYKADIEAFGYTYEALRAP